MARYAVGQAGSIAWKETDSLLQAEKEREMAHEAGIRNVQIVDNAFGSAVIDLRVVPTLDRPGGSQTGYTREELVERAMQEARPAERLHVVYMLPDGRVIADSRRAQARVVAYVQEHPGCTVAELGAELGEADVAAAVKAGLLLQKGDGPHGGVATATLTVAEDVSTEVLERLAPRRVPRPAWHDDPEQPLGEDVKE